MNNIYWEYFVAVAEELNFTRAAKRLYVSQQSLSSYIAKLEKYYGVELLDRGKGLTLTAAGESFYQNAKKMVDLETQISVEMKDIRDFRSNCLRIGVSTNRGTRMMPQFLVKVKEEYPELRVELVEKRLKDLNEGLLAGKIDVMFGYSEGKNPDIKEEVYSREEMKIVVSDKLWSSVFTGEERMQIERQERLSLAAFEKCPYIGLAPGTWMNSQISRYCVQRDITLKTDLCTSSLGTMLHLCIAGLGFTVCPDTYLNIAYMPEKSMESLHIFRIDSDDMMQDRVIKYLNNRYIPRITKEVIRIARETLGPGAER